MTSTTDFETLIAGAARGSSASLLQLVTFVGVNHCSERQIERFLTALHIRLDRRHISLPPGTTNGKHYQLALLSLHCLASLAAKNFTCPSPSLKLAERLTSFWPLIWSWIQLMHSFISNDKDFNLAFRLQAKTVVLSVLHFFAGCSRLKAVLSGTTGVLALIFDLWHLETKCYDFDPSNRRFNTAPVVVTMNHYLPLLHRETLDWQNTPIAAVQGTASDVAFVALTHLRHDAEQARRHLYTICMDVKMLAYLSCYIPLRHAILSKHSVMEVTRVAASLSSQKFSTTTAGEMGSCLTTCFNYILLNMISGDVWAWTIQSLDGQLLRAMLASAQWQNQLDDQEVLLKLSDAITKNLTTRLVTLAASRAVKKVRGHGLEDRFLRAGDSPLRRKWLALKQLIEERESLIPWDDEGRKNPLKSCDNHKCRRREDTEGTFKRCGGCLSSFYCSSLCQKEHWKREHKSYCQQVQASRQEGALCSWSAKDHHFMSMIMDHDLQRRHYELHEAQRDQGIDLVVAELDYTVVPFKMTVGSLTSCPLNDNGEEEIRAKWDGVVNVARSRNGNLVKRCLVPTGETSKLLMEPGNFVCHCDDHLEEGGGDGDDLPKIESAGGNYSLQADAS